MRKRVFVSVLFIAVVILPAASFAQEIQTRILNMWWPPLVAVGDYVYTTRDYRIEFIIADNPADADQLDIHANYFRLSREWKRVIVFAVNLKSGQKLPPTEIILAEE